MGQVTIGELTEELLPFTEKGNKVITIAIVPRAIPERIMYYCDRILNAPFYNSKEKGVAYILKCYTAMLLKEFEEGGADDRSGIPN